MSIAIFTFVILPTHGVEGHNRETSERPKYDRGGQVAALVLPCNQPESRIVKLPMTPELQHAVKRHTQWFGSYKRSGELKKIQVWLVVNQGRREFVTLSRPYNVKRLR